MTKLTLSEEDLETLESALQSYMLTLRNCVENGENSEEHFAADRLLKRIEKRLSSKEVNN